MPTLNKRCQCDSGVRCMVTALVSNSEQIPCELDMTEEDFLCDPCRRHGNEMHCHKCISVANPNITV